VSLSGVLVDRVTAADAAAVLARFVRDGGRHQVVTVNTDFVRLADRDHGYRAILNAADLAVADGMPLIWFSRLGKAGLPERVAGIDLVDVCCRLATSYGIPLFLLGAGPDVAASAGRALQSRHPGLRIVGTFAPRFGPATAEDEAQMVDLIRRAGRCILLVAFGAPRQDRFIAAHLEEFDAPIAMGVGGAFDILAGTIPRAPVWMQRSGFEWTWRLVQEPGRLWRRYLLHDVPFLLKLAARAIRGRTAALEPR
jgi:N-acetylglucosaminyldiphosphoundecaprenol N-acetyl-beta-D-mannosaminyltransferase